MTHDFPRAGSLVWVAEPTFDEEPTIDVVQAIQAWRWCVFFPVEAAIRRKIITRIGTLDVLPEAIKALPIMRSGSRDEGWTLMKFEDGVSRVLGAATDPSVPIYQVVNDTALREMIVSGWRPEKEW